MLVSVIVPVLADLEAAAALLRQTRPDPRAEWIVVDGGADPSLAGIVAGRRDVILVQSPRGRGVQMNAGAARANGDWLLFLHADSRLPVDWLNLLEVVATAGDPGWNRERPEGVASRADRRRGVEGGWFQFALDDDSWQARVIERGVRWRVQLFRLPYGDQGIFVSRRIFGVLGGFRELPLMEDVDFVRRLVARAQVCEIPAPLVTSARRWRRDGWWRRSLRNLLLVTLFFIGVAPDRLARWYD